VSEKENNIAQVIVELSFFVALSFPFSDEIVCPAQTCFSVIY
jgi:hypothetical protein